MLALASFIVSSFEVERFVDNKERRGRFLMDDSLEEVEEEVVAIERIEGGMSATEERLSVK